MEGMIMAGFVLVVTMFVVMARINLLRFLGYSTIVDIAFTVLMFIMFAHTFSGVVAGSFAGLFMAAGLTLARKLVGYERLVFKRTGLVRCSLKPRHNCPFRATNALSQEG